jgi:large subunit ribosomal protein L1
MASNRMAQSATQVNSQQAYEVAQAIELACKTANAKFRESIDVAIRLGIVPTKENVRGACQLPHGTGRVVRIAVFASPDQADELKKAGANTVGLDDLVSELNERCDYDVIIASPDVMRTHVSKLAKILGPKGLMPNPKVGTVATDLLTAVKDAKAGKAYYRNDKGGIVHSTIGKADFTVEQLRDNLMSLLQALERAKPSTAKGKYLKAMSISATMGPGVAVDLSTVKL